MKVSNKKRVLSVLLAVALLFTGIVNRGAFEAEAADAKTKLIFEAYYASDGGYLCFTTENLPADAAEWYAADGIIVDGTSSKTVEFKIVGKKILIEDWIWGKNAPTSSLKIPAGTTLKEFTTSPWGFVENGKTMTIENAISLIKENDTWKEKETIDLTYENRYNSDFYFIADTIPSNAAKYYVADEIIVDDVASDSVKFTTSNGKLLIENWFFGGANQPKSSIKIPAGTMLKEFSASESTWGPVENGKTLSINNEISLVNDNGTWKLQEAVAKVTDHTPNLDINYVPVGRTNLMANYDFSVANSHTCKGDAAIKDGMGVINLNNATAHNVNYILSAGVQVTEGVTYKMSYYVQIVDSKSINFDMQFAGSPLNGEWGMDYLFSGYKNVEGTTLTIDGVAANGSLTTDTKEWKLVEFTWTAKASDWTNFCFWSYGGGEGTIYIDDLVVYDISSEVDATNVDVKYVNVPNATSIQFTTPENFVPSVSDWATAAQNVAVIINGERKTVTLNIGIDTNQKYIYLQGNPIAEAIANGYTIEVPDQIYVKYPEAAIIYNFGSKLYIAKLGQGWAMYRSEYTYPNGDNKFYYNIDNGTSYKITSSNDAVAVEGFPDLTTGSEINTVGTYHITRIEDEKLYNQVVVLYKHGDANESNKITVADLVALKWAENGTCEKQTERIAGTFAADIDGDAGVNATDVSAMHYALVSADPTETLSVNKADSLLNGKMPIVGFGVYDIEGKTTDEIYTMVSDLGINAVSFNNKDYSTPGMEESTLAHLQLAEKNGIGIYVQDNQLHLGYNQLNYTFDQKLGDMPKRVGLYSMYKSFLGTYVVDEPSTEQYYLRDKDGNPKNELPMSDYADDINMMKDYTNLNTYVNLLPYAASSLQATEEKYSNYLTNTFKTYELDMLSYDNYPAKFDKQNIVVEIQSKEIEYKDFYINLRLARKSASEANKPFWIVAQAGLYPEDYNGTINKDKRLTKAEMQWEVNASLACGAKGIQYYSVVQTADHIGTENDAERSGLIKSDGEKHGTYYDAAKETNKFVATVDHILMNAENKGVIVNDSNAKASLGDMILAQYKEVKSVTGSNALVGCFDYYGKTALLVVNCSTSKSQDITLNFNGTQQYEVTTYDRITTTGSGASYTANIGAGQCALVVLK